MKKILLAVLFALVGFSVPSLSLGQTPNGTIVGVVTDSTGGSVVGATVTAVSVDSGATRTVTTTANGTFRFESLLPGTYKIKTSAPNFSETLVDGLIVPASVVTTSNVVLKTGSASAVVDVEADNSIINTDNGQLSGTISSDEISMLPINSNNPYELALTLPGVATVSQGGFSNGFSYSVGGGRPRANNFLIEGQDNNDAGIQGQGLQPGNPEAVGEVIILQNAYTAEYGHGAGSVANLIYKNGTNTFHGSVFERLLNSSIDATDHYDTRNGIVKSKYRENLFGFTIGGPILRDKLFFFAAYQWDNYRSSANGSTLIVPSAAGYATLKALPSNVRINNLIEAYGGLVGDYNKLLSSGGTTSLPLGNDPNSGAARGNVQLGQVNRSFGVATSSPELDTKGTWIINQKDTLNLRYIRSSYLAPIDAGNFPGQLPGFDTNQNGVSHNSGIVETHAFNPNLLNDIRFSYGRIGFTFGLPSSTTSNPLFGTPGVGITGVTGYGIPTNIPQGRFHNVYQLQDTLNWTKGKHFLKFGFDIEDVRVRDQIPFNFYGTISYGTGYKGSPSGLANYIDDFGGGGSISQNFGSPTARPRLISQNYFAEDTWKPTANLSVDLGFRYEYTGAPFNAPGTPYPGIDYSNPTCFPGAGVVCNTQEQSDGSDWGPRFGLTYSPQFFGAHKTVIRSGFGVYYDVVFTNIIDNIQATAPNAASPTVNSLTSASKTRGTANWSQQFVLLNHSPLPSNTAEPISDHLLNPRTLSWNLTVEQELPFKFTFQGSYVGQRGEHLYGTTEFNPYVNDFASAARRLPTRGNIVVRDNSGDSEYSALWTELDRKFSHGFLFRANYTYGRALDDGSEIFTTNNESTYGSASYPVPRGSVDWGLSAYDHRHIFNFTYIWAPPIWHTDGSMKIVGNIVNRWSIAGITKFQSGAPENVEVGYDVNGDGISNDRPLVGNPKAPLLTYAFDGTWDAATAPGQYYCEGSEFWDTNDPCHVVPLSSVRWVVPTPGTRPAATVGRNNLISPGFQDWDINIQRSFAIWRDTHFDFRAELFNAFNHGNAVIGNTTLTSGIPYTAGGYGNPTFAEYGPTVSGYRHARFFVKYQF